MLGEAYSGLRTCEVLEWGDDVFGTRAEDGKNLHVWRCKGQHDNNPYVACHAGREALLTALAAWLKVSFAETCTFFPSYCGGRVGLRALAHALLRLFKKGKLKLKLTSHGMRAFYVLIRRSQGASDEQIAPEIGHTSNGLCIKKTYGSAPDSWRNGGAPNLSWLPVDPKNYAWAELEKNGWKFTPEQPEAAKLAA